MYENNIDIDKPRSEWTDEAIENLFIFCQLDRAMPYEKVCNSYQALIDAGLGTFESLKNSNVEKIAYVLVKSGFRFYNQTAEFLHYNASYFTAKQLFDMDREDIVKNVKGFGYKLASMFFNRLHGFKYAIIDVHIDKFIGRMGFVSNDYRKKEAFFFKLAEESNTTPEHLDWLIWETNRIGNRNAR